MRFRKIFFTYLVSLILGCLFVVGINFNFNLHNIKAFFEAENNLYELTPTYKNYELNNNVLTSINDDGQLEFEDIDKFVSKINISISKDNDNPLPIEIFYTDNVNGEYQIVRKDYSSLDITASFEVNSYISKLRIDISNTTGDTFKLNSVSVINTNGPIGANVEFLVQVLIVSFIVFFILCHIVFKVKDVYNVLFKYRWYIGFTIILFCVIFEVTGSSISLWGNYFSSESNGLLFGVPRMIRTDEWATSSAMAISQNYSGYSYFSDIIRGGGTDAFIVYGQPVFHIGEIFRPFHWGYLLLGSSRGLAFFWSARLVCLLLLSFEFFRWLTKDNRAFSLLGAVMIAFAPIVQWWFAINGLVEMLIALELSLLMLIKYIDDRRWIHRIFYLCIIYLCAGMYIFTFYPAWMIPIAFILLGFIIFILIDRWKDLYFSKKDIFIIIGVTIIFALLIIFVFVKSKGTISAVLNTAYPGNRFETGGQQSKVSLFTSIVSIFFPYKDRFLPNNVVELSMMIDFFPIGILLSLIVVIKDKLKDKLLVILLILQLFFITYLIVGFTPLVAKLTFMYNVPSGRATIAFGIINILLLIRVLTCHRLHFKLSSAIVFSICYGILITMLCKNQFPLYLGLKSLIIIFVISLFFSYFILYGKTNSKILCACLSVVMLITGLSVNPIQHSLDVVEKSSLSLKLREIQEQDPGLWVFEGEDYPVTNYPIMSGIPLINSTNVYPNLDLWYMLDSQKEYEQIYNRYAHIRVNLGNALEDKFVLAYPDVFVLNATLYDLQQINVKYILTRRNLDDFNNEKIYLEKIASIDNHVIYKLID